MQRLKNVIALIKGSNQLTELIKRDIILTGSDVVH